MGTQTLTINFIGSVRKKINCIKIFRAYSGYGLKESKHIIEGDPVELKKCSFWTRKGLIFEFEVDTSNFEWVDRKQRLDLAAQDGYITYTLGETAAKLSEFEADLGGDPDGEMIVTITRGDGREVKIRVPREVFQFDAVFGLNLAYPGHHIYVHNNPFGRSPLATDG